MPSTRASGNSQRRRARLNPGGSQAHAAPAIALPIPSSAKYSPASCGVPCAAAYAVTLVCTTPKMTPTLIIATVSVTRDGQCSLAPARPAAELGTGPATADDVPVAGPLGPALGVASSLDRSA